MREEAGSDQNNETVAVALGSDEFLPAIALEFLLKADGVTDLREFELDQLVIQVAVGMDVCENFVRLLITALRQEVARRFWDEEHEGDLQERWECLDDCGGTPLPVAVDVVGSVGQPSGDN